MRLQDDDFLEPHENISLAEIDPHISSKGISALHEYERGSFAVLEYAATYWPNSGKDHLERTYGPLGTVGSHVSLLGMLEWRDQLNTSAMIVADRRWGAPGERNSVWSDDRWEGYGCFGDNHVQYVIDEMWTGKYGSNKGGSTASIGLLFDCCRGEKGEGRLVAD